MTGSWAPQKESRLSVTVGFSVAAHKLVFLLKLNFPELEDLNNQNISQIIGQADMISSCFVGKLNQTGSELLIFSCA